MQKKINNNLIKVTEVKVNSLKEVVETTDNVHYFTSLTRVAKFFETYRDKIDYYYMKKMPLTLKDGTYVGRSFMFDIEDGTEVKYKDIN